MKNYKVSIRANFDFEFPALDDKSAEDEGLKYYFNYIIDNAYTEELKTKGILKDWEASVEGISNLDEIKHRRF